MWLQFTGSVNLRAVTSVSEMWPQFQSGDLGSRDVSCNTISITVLYTSNPQRLGFALVEQTC